MTASVSAYTTLESLLIFQCLKSYGMTPTAFSKTSDLLKANPDITGHQFFQSGRLSPDALRTFYLERLRRELELELELDQSGDSHGQDGGNPKKRKAKAPPLPTVQESLQHTHLLPKLVEKLYATYRNEIIDQVRADEDRYEQLQRQVKSIEGGEWDEQLRDRVNGKTPSSRSPSLAKQSPHVAQSPLPQPALPNGARGPDGPQHAVPKTSPRKKKDQRPAPAASQPLAVSPSPHPPQLAHFQQPPPPNAAYNGPPHPQLSPYPPSPAPGPPGPQYQPQPIQPYAPNGVPQYAPPHSGPPHFSPSQRFPQQPPGPRSPGMHTAQQQKGYFPHPVPASHPPQHLSQPPPPQAGFMLPPFQVSPQDPSRVHHPPVATPQYPQVSTPINKRSSQSHHNTPNASRPGAPFTHPLVTQARQSFSTPLNNRSPHSAMSTPRSAKTFWKLQMPGTPGGAPGTPRPPIESIDDFVPLSASKQSPAKPKSQRKPRGKGKGKEKELEKTSEERPVLDADAQPETPLPTSSLEVPAPDSGTRQGRSRRKATAKRGRPGSVASSRAGGSVRDRSRSRSILSHTETVADTDSQTGHRIKTERRGSLDDGIEEEAVNTPLQMATRRRGAAAPTSAPRKRNAREASLAESEDQSGTPGPPRTIIAHRNFQRTCQPMLDDITSHKHASIFTTAVRAKDAEGYYDIIKRPTDLSAIKKALASGAKHINSVGDAPIGSPGGAGATIELPVSSDVVPPKAIVNPAQLEKELMRMFVNALMFNPGEDGVVEDAREMFESVQRSVSSWRNVHGRSQGRADAGEGTPVEGDEEGTSSKRRKV